MKKDILLETIDNPKNIDFFICMGKLIVAFNSLESILKSLCIIGMDAYKYDFDSANHILKNIVVSRFNFSQLLDLFKQLVQFVYPIENQYPENKKINLELTTLCKKANKINESRNFYVHSQYFKDFFTDNDIMKKENKRGETSFEEMNSEKISNLLNDIIKFRLDFEKFGIKIFLIKRK